MDLIDDDGPAGSGPGNTPEFTVAELSGAVKRTLEGAFGRIRVRGEIGRVVNARSGHIYYDLKDDRNVLACTTWRGQVPGLGLMPEQGLEVIATGRLTAYGAQSRYQLTVDSLEIAGEGALMAMLERRRKALAAEGLFDAARKRRPPYLPEVIGVITSPQGAVIRDILHRLRDRFPRRVLIWPVAVQGQGAAEQVARAIAGFNALSPGGALPRPDVLIVARGGGSLEDLMPFNEEAVVRAAAASAIPLISAVGHETDTTLIDLAADLRAPTPTAAAEMAVPVRAELIARVHEQGTRLARAAALVLARRRERLAALARALPRPQALLDTPRQRLDFAGERLPGALAAATAAKRRALLETGGHLRPALLRGLVREAARRHGEAGRRLEPAARAALRAARQRLEVAARGLAAAAIAREIARARRELAGLAGRLERAMSARLEAARARLADLDRLRRTLGYTETLRRGFAVAWEGERLVTSAAAARRARALEIEFHDGRVPVGAPAQGSGAGKGRGGGGKGNGGGDGGQGSLF